MPVAANLLRVTRPAVAVCPEMILGRSYLGLIEASGNLLAYRYADGVMQELMASISIAGQLSSALGSVFRHHAVGDVVVGLGVASGTSQLAIWTWDIDAATLTVLSTGYVAATIHGPVYAGSGTVAWAVRSNAATGEVRTYIETIGSSGTLDPVGDAADVVELGADEDLTSVVTMSSGLYAFHTTPLVTASRSFSQLPSGPVGVASGLPAWPSARSPHPLAAGALARVTELKEYGVFSSSGVFARWTPAAWFDEPTTFLNEIDVSPSGSEWIFLTGTSPNRQLTRLAVGVVGLECDRPAVAVGPAFATVRPTHFLCRD